MGVDIGHALGDGSDEPHGTRGHAAVEWTAHGFQFVDAAAQAIQVIGNLGASVKGLLRGGDEGTVGGNQSAVHGRFDG